MRLVRRRLGFVCACLIASSAAMTTTSAATTVMHGRSTVSARGRLHAHAALSGVNVFRTEFYAPLGFATGGGHVWVLNPHTVTELAASTDQLVQVLSVGYHFGVNSSNGPNGNTAITSNGSDVWVTVDGEDGSFTQSVTELSATTGRF